MHDSLPREPLVQALVCSRCAGQFRCKPLYIPKEGVLRAGRARGRNAVEEGETENASRLLPCSTTRIPVYRRRGRRRSKRPETRAGPGAAGANAAALTAFDAARRGRLARLRRRRRRHFLSERPRADRARMCSLPGHPSGSAAPWSRGRRRAWSSRRSTGGHG